MIKQLILTQNWQNQFQNVILTELLIFLLECTYHYSIRLHMLQSGFGDGAAIYRLGHSFVELL